MYRSGGPNWLARPMNRLAAWQFRHGILTFGGRGVTLDVRGRVSGRTVSLPLVLVQQDGERYLVSMLGEDVQWLRNVRADGGRAVLHARRTETVRLVDVPVEQRAPVLRRYVELAPGGRPHIPVPVGAPVEDFAAVAARYPVLRVEPASAS
jgi:hypothetical protein